MKSLLLAVIASLSFSARAGSTIVELVKEPIGNTGETVRVLVLEDGNVIRETCEQARCLSENIFRVNPKELQKFKKNAEILTIQLQDGIEFDVTPKPGDVQCAAMPTKSLTYYVTWRERLVFATAKIICGKATLAMSKEANHFKSVLNKLLDM